jgi:hypothetical protein
VTAGLGGKHADMLELLGEIEQHVRPDDVLPDGFFLVDSGRLASLDQLPRSRSARLCAERVHEDVRILVDQSANKIREMNPRAFFP